VGNVRAPTVIAIDWSGARGDGPLPGIWVTAYRGSKTVADDGHWSRADAIRFVREQPGRVVVGFDFSFGPPAWFARELGCVTIDDFWSRAVTDGEAWLAPRPPFWDTKCTVPFERRFRRCERRLRADGVQPKSLFALVGNGQVGRGSIRGMPFLAQLRAAGFAIWPFDPFDPASERVVVEIYPSLLRRRFPHFVDAAAPSTDARDARASARVMQTRADEFAHLVATTDPDVRLEGDVWEPATWP
jgi:hypothetical protein